MVLGIGVWFWSTFLTSKPAQEGVGLAEGAGEGAELMGVASWGGGGWWNLQQ